MQILITLSKEEKQKIDNCHKALFVDVYNLMAKAIKEGRIISDNDSESTALTNIKSEDIEKWQKDVDILLHPYMMIVHPSKKEMVERTLKEIGKSDDYVIHEIPYIDEDKIYVIGRKWFEEQSRPKINFDCPLPWE